MNIKIVKQQFEEGKITRDTFFEGTGLHMGQRSRIIVRDNPRKNGIIFVYHKIRVKIEPKNVGSEQRTTYVMHDGQIFVMTIEHLMSALLGLGVINAEIELQGTSEIPILSGDSYAFVEKLLPNIKKTKSQRDMVVVIGNAIIKDRIREGGFISLKPSNSNFLKIKSFISYKNLEIRNQSFDFDFRNSSSYIKEISHARTSFPHRLDSQEEITKLKTRLKGATIRGDDRNINIYSKEKLQTFYDNEIARHKILDFLGDLKTSGVILTQTRVELHKTGHLLNLKLAKLLRKEFDSFP